MTQSAYRLITSLGSLLFIIGSLYIYSAFINPQLPIIQELRGERIATLDLLNRYREAIQKQEGIIFRFQNLKPEQLDVLNRMLPSSPEIPMVLNQLYGLANMNNISVNAVNFQSTPLKIEASESLVRPYNTIEAHIKFVGTYQDMKNYLKAIESNMRLMKINSIHITDGFKDDPSLSYQMVVETFYLSEK